jgi:hypothetical protein
MMLVLKIVGLWTLASVPASLLIGAFISRGNKPAPAFSNAFRVADEHAQDVADLVALGHADALRALPITRLRLAGLLIPTL